MDNDMKRTIVDLLEKLKTISYVKPEVIPNIELYMDQVTSFIEGQLADSKRRTDDKLLTKTMINNYTKNDLLPPPVKKKYSKEHVLSLIFIYYFKNILSINDIRSILGPITDKYFGQKGSFNMEDVYNEIFRLEKEESMKVLKDFSKKYGTAKKAFPDFPEEDRQYLQNFAYICLLSYDVYTKKMLIEKIIDDIIEDKDKQMHDPS
uniref:DUF1836 domain-containing protein n=1 Tax=Agathobacter sp. TaxID=2021311 RepID=UPI0040566AB5